MRSPWVSIEIEIERPLDRAWHRFLGEADNAFGVIAPFRT